jgi:FKBP-type peptidyl-prolyl cis-trans isomerase (trigger factor)
MMKQRLLALGWVMVWPWSSLLAQLAVEVAGSVNQELIPMAEVQAEAAPLETALREKYRGPDLAAKIKEARVKALNALIDRKLIHQEFKAQGLSVSEAEIEGRVQEIVKNEYESDQASFAKNLEANGSTLEKFRLDVKEQLMREKLFAKLAEKEAKSSGTTEKGKVKQTFLERLRAKAAIRIF